MGNQIIVKNRRMCVRNRRLVTSANGAPCVCGDQPEPSLCENALDIIDNRVADRVFIERFRMDYDVQTEFVNNQSDTFANKSTWIVNVRFPATDLSLGFFENHPTDANAHLLLGGVTSQGVPTCPDIIPESSISVVNETVNNGVSTVTSEGSITLGGFLGVRVTVDKVPRLHNGDLAYFIRRFVWRFESDWEFTNLNGTTTGSGPYEVVVEYSSRGADGLYNTNDSYGKLPLLCTPLNGGVSDEAEFESTFGFDAEGNPNHYQVVAVTSYSGTDSQIAPDGSPDGYGGGNISSSFPPFVTVPDQFTSVQPFGPPRPQVFTSNAEIQINGSPRLFDPENDPLTCAPSAAPPGGVPGATFGGGGFTGAPGSSLGVQGNPQQSQIDHFGCSVCGG